MFFFTKKVFLADALEGLVDMHNHLLPNIDDGSDSMQTTKAMIAAYRDIGVKGVYTTPHTMEDYYGNDVATIRDCFDQTKSQLSPDDSKFLLGTASEYMMDGQFPELIKNSNYLTLPGNQLLFEFSYFQKPFNAEELIFEMKNHNLQPILAHPERYRYLTTTQILDLKARGCALQLNLLSLTGHYGNDAKIKSEELLAGSHYDMAATDAHKVEHLIKLKESKLKEKVGSQLKPIIF